MPWPTHVGLSDGGVELDGLVEVPHGLVTVQAARLLRAVVHHARARQQQTQPGRPIGHAYTSPSLITQTGLQCQVICAICLPGVGMSVVGIDLEHLMVLEQRLTTVALHLLHLSHQHQHRRQTRPHRWYRPCHGSGSTCAYPKRAGTSAGSLWSAER